MRLLRALSIVTAALCCAQGASAASEIADTNWPSYGNSTHTTKYAPLDQIDAGNAGTLKVAWTWATPDNAVVAADRRLTPWSLKSTPIKIGNTLYVSTSLGFVAALDAGTGRERWRFDTQTYADGRPTNLGFNHRGVAFWGDGKQGRILMPTNNGYLWALDAETGRPIPGFGEAGRVDLTLGLGRAVDRTLYSVISAPVVIGDVVVVGSSIMDGPRNKTMPPGHVRGFNVATGEQVWIFHTIPQKGEFGSETWEQDAWTYSGNTNVWTGLSADPELGYVYIPTGTPTNDWYGGHRLGDNLFAESLVALEAKTGKRVWHFQMVHHGLWDYDLPAAPTLVDIRTPTGVIKAVAQVSKQAYVYVFDRVTGVPLWPIEERPAPASSVPGERASATQPHPSRPAAIDRQGLTVDDLIDFSPTLRAEAEAIIADFDYGPLFTPPTLKGTINLPGWAGGANWSGAAFDPETNLLYTPSVTSPIVAKLKAANPDETDFRYVRSSAVTRVRGPRGLPLTKPPYGRITAIDLGTGEHAWMVPHGDGPRQKVIDLGLPDPGPLGGGGTGPVLTKTLLFLAQADGKRNVLRAFDKGTGAVVAEVELPYPPYGTPMTYMSGGEQFIVIATGMGERSQFVALKRAQKTASTKR